MYSIEDPGAVLTGETPAWCSGATEATAFFKGARALYHVPGVVLFCTAIGYGAFAHDAEFSFGQTLFVTLSMFALPGQVVLVDEVVRGASLAAAAFAVTLTAIRLLPLTATLVPLLRDDNGRTGPLVWLGAHFIAVTAWVEGMRTLPALPPGLRLAHHLGVGFALLASVMLASAAGFLLAGSLPPVIAAALLFMTPIYFLLSLIATAAARADLLAIILGAALGPLMFMLAPGFDLLVTGVVGGSIAYGLSRGAGT